MDLDGTSVERKRRVVLDRRGSGIAARTVARPRSSERPAPPHLAIPNHWKAPLARLCGSRSIHATEVEMGPKVPAFKRTRRIFSHMAVTLVPPLLVGLSIFRSSDHFRQGIGCTQAATVRQCSL